MTTKPNILLPVLVQTLNKLASQTPEFRRRLVNERPAANENFFLLFMKNYSNQTGNALNTPPSIFKRCNRLIDSLRVLILVFLLSSLAAVNLHAVDIALANGVPFNDSLTASTPQTGWKYYYLD